MNGVLINPAQSDSIIDNTRAETFCNERFYVFLARTRPIASGQSRTVEETSNCISLIFRQATAGSDSSTSGNWFKTMLSIPPRKPLATLQKFTAWSAFLAYFVSGVLGMVFLQILNLTMFDMKLSGRDYEFLRLNCGLIAVIGLLYIAAARSRPMVLGNGAILGTVPERLFVVSAILIWLYHQSLVPFVFAANLTVLDSLLATITYIIWSRNTPGASPKKCVKEIADIMLPILGPPRKWSSTCTQIIGYSQLVLSITFIAQLEIARDALGLDEFVGFSKGMLALFFMSMMVIGWLHVLGGGDGNESTPIAAVFYRLAGTVPLVSVMYYFDRIERGLALAMGISDLISAFIILMSLCTESLPSKAKN